jgi:hypothetical protein
MPVRRAMTERLFDPDHPTREDARRARDEALEQVEEHAEPDWKTLALDAVRRTCEARATFIADDVWTVGGLTSTREDRALGPVFLKAARNGWCVKTDRVRPSVRSHLSGKPVWLSLLYTNGAGG